MTAICHRTLHATLDQLEGRSPEAQLSELKALCIAHGTWTIPEIGPEGVKRYSPVLYEISLFGVSAISDDIEGLPRNWLRAARATLTGLPEGCAA